ncbi:MAG: hypothetical protein ACOCTI_06470 [Phycisphaeraceae bacterium]
MPTPPDADHPRSDSPAEPPSQDATSGEKAEAAAAATGAAVGCFSVALLPFSLALLAALLLIVIAFFRGCPAAGERQAQPGPDLERPAPTEVE